MYSDAQGAEARLAAGDVQKIFALCCVTSFKEVSSSMQRTSSLLFQLQESASAYLGEPRRPLETSPHPEKRVLLAELHLDCVLQVILVEADSLPLRNPTDLFETAAFRQHGSLFWPGHWSASQGDRPGFLDPAAYTLFGLKLPWLADPDAFATAETGQLLLNRHVTSADLPWKSPPFPISQCPG